MKNGLIFLLFVLLVLSLAGHSQEPAAQIEDTTRSLPLPADFQVCIPIRNGPLRPPVHNGPYRHERGIA